MTHSFYLDNSPGAVAVREHRRLVEKISDHVLSAGALLESISESHVTTIAMWRASIPGVEGDILPMLQVQRIPLDIAEKMDAGYPDPEDLLIEHYRTWIWFLPTRLGWINAWAAARNLAVDGIFHVAAGPVVAVEVAPAVGFEVLSATRALFVIERRPTTTDPETFFDIKAPPAFIGFADIETARDHAVRLRRYRQATAAAARRTRS